ncbi:MAG: hypothetical protein ABSE89_04670 [Sedimentisphaerales bacterium]
MDDAEPEFFEINYPFGTLIVDEDIYYRIVKDKTKRPYCKFKTIKGINFLNKIIRCRIGDDKTYSLARLLMQPGRNELVDHINRNPLDNRRCKLRIVSPRQNSLNRTTTSSTGYIGVSMTNNRGKMRLRTTFQTAGKRLRFGMNDEPENRIICALAHDKFVIQAGDEEYAPLNFPILRNEPFRSELLKMDMSEFRKESIKLFIKKLAIQ